MFLCISLWLTTHFEEVYTASWTASLKLAVLRLANITLQEKRIVMLKTFFKSQFTWPPVTSSNLGPFSHSQTLTIWKCSNSFKNQYFSTKFGHKVYFYVWSTLKIRKWQFLQNFPIFPIFPIFQKIPILDHFWAKIPDRDIHLMPSNLMILLMLLHIYQILQYQGSTSFSSKDITNF